MDRNANSDLVYSVVSSPAVFEFLMKAHSEGRQVNREEFDELVKNDERLKTHFSSNENQGRKRSGT